VVEPVNEPDAFRFAVVNDPFVSPLDLKYMAALDSTDTKLIA
jgi:hypothetical protein